MRQSFDAAMIRLNPCRPGLAAAGRPAVRWSRSIASQLLRAKDIFAEEIGKSFSVDLADLSRDTWSLIPSIGNLLVEVRTRKYGTLTYAHDGSDQEDISLFDRARRRNLAIYSSRSKLATRGPFFDEDTDAEIDVLDYNVDTTFVPERFWMEGRTRLRVRVRCVCAQRAHPPTGGTAGRAFGDQRPSTGGCCTSASAIRTAWSSIFPSRSIATTC